MYSSCMYASHVNPHLDKRVPFRGVAPMCEMHMRKPCAALTRSPVVVHWSTSYMPHIARWFEHSARLLHKPVAGRWHVHGAS